MKLYEPWVYCKWGLICGVLSIVPHLSLLGLCLFALGIALELVERATSDRRSSPDRDETGTGSVGEADRAPVAKPIAQTQSGDPT